MNDSPANAGSAPESVARSIAQRSLVVRSVRWMFSWRGVRRMLILLAWLITLVVLFHAEENWRGRRAWNRLRQELEGRGKRLDFIGLIPKPAPDERNFAATPVVRSWFGKDGHSAAVSPGAFTHAAGMVPSRSKGGRHFLDLPAWKLAFAAVQSGSRADGQRFRFQTTALDRDARTNAAAAVLAGLKSSEALLNELREASRRPSSVYPVVYERESPWLILMPHLAQLKAAAGRLQLRACAALAAGQSDAALADVKLGCYLADSLKPEPFLISYLVRIACLQMMMQPIWEGLAEHRWSESQLLELQTLMGGYDLIAEVEPPLDTERAAAILAVDLVSQRKNYNDLISGDSSRRANPLMRLIPNGWLDFEKYNYCRLFDLLFNGTMDFAGKRVSPGQMAANEHELEERLTGGGSWLGKNAVGFIHHQLAANLLLPFGKVALKVAMAQAATDEAAIACALERYRLVHGRFPESLEILAPRFIAALPRDPITGQAYRYRRTSEDRFALYSVGWNMSDEGGTTGERLFDEKKGDWVWEYSEQ